MHVLILFVDLLGVCLRGKSGEALLEAVDAHGLVTGDQYIDAKVKFVSVYEQRVRYVFADDARFVDIYVVDVVDQVNAFALARVGWFHNPHILLALVLL